MKLPVLFDVDGVCNDFTGELLATLKEKNFDVPDYESFTTFELSKELSKKAWLATRKILEDENFWASLPTLEVAREAVDLIRSYGVEVVFVFVIEAVCESDGAGCEVDGGKGRIGGIASLEGHGGFDVVSDCFGGVGVCDGFCVDIH